MPSHTLPIRRDAPRIFTPVSQIQSPPISPPPFLDVPTLLEASRPQKRINFFWSFAGVFGLLLVMQFAGGADDATRKAIEFFTGLMLLTLVGASVGFSVFTMRRLRAQQQTVDAIEEMMLLRRWDPAGLLLNRFLSSPVRSSHLWAAGLTRLAELLGRHHRFEDAITVQNFIIENQLLDDHGDYLMRMARTMAMLREDHLVDADRAISDLRGAAPKLGRAGLH